MRTSLFAAFRSSDGRSLARAMAVLVLLGLLPAGFHAGAMAGETAGGVVLCLPSLDEGNPVPTGPGDHRADCCLAGCIPTPLAACAAIGFAAIERPPSSSFASRPLPLAEHTPAVIADAAPRGPPALA